MIAAVFCLTVAVLALYAWAYYDLDAQHRRLEVSVSAAARTMFRQRRRIQQLTAERDEARRQLAVAHIVTDTLGRDLAEALHIGESTPTHDAVVVDLFAKQLEQPSRDWPL